eukprot:COSAG02_NODE_2296_length_9197_cov_11.568587_7_plen_286_part_00
MLDVTGVGSSDGVKLGILDLARDDALQLSSQRGSQQLARKNSTGTQGSVSASQQSSQLGSQQSQISEELCSSQPLVGRSSESGHQRQQQASLLPGANQPQSHMQREITDHMHVSGEQQASQEDEEEKERRELEERKARRRKRLAEKKLAAANSGYYKPSSDNRGDAKLGVEQEEEEAAALEHDGEHGGRRCLTSPLGRRRERDDDTGAHVGNAGEHDLVSKDSGAWESTGGSTASNAGMASGRCSTSDGLPGIQMSQQEIVSQQGLSQRHNKRSYKDKMRLLGLG